MKRIFINPKEKRLRAGWRLLLQFGLQALLGLLILLALSIIPNIQSAFPNSLVFFLLIESLSITLSVVLARRILDRRSITSMGLNIDRRAFKDLAVGLIIAALMMGFIYILE